MPYAAPVDDILDALKTAAGLECLIESGTVEGLDEATLRAVIEEAGRFGAEVLAPLNALGDKHGSKLADGRVETPPGWKEAYAQFTAQGWSALPCPAEYGGQGLPAIAAMAVCEIWNSANLAFGMCPLLTNGAIDSLMAGASDGLKARYLPPMIAGRWTGTMNLTEPQAGSDLNAVRTMARPAGDGTYRITGTKIFISYGDHDLTENIVHLVLARLPDAPPGTKGISLFLVPKRLVEADGSLGTANDVVCAGLEKKLGIRASPTAVMKFGEQGGAVGFLVGEENKGLATMFVMMNQARLAVGIQGVAIAERALQQALAYARERRQGRTASVKDSEMSPIIEHADVRRMLLTMKALTQAARAICLATASALDCAHRAPSTDARAAAVARVALLTPVAKAFATEAAVEVASLGIQIHGGMGFIEETGAAQHLRDARILPIYEGTNGIQALDLVVRKLPLSGGAALRAFLTEMRETAEAVTAHGRSDYGLMGKRLVETLGAVEQAAAYLSKALETEPEVALAGATPFLKLMGLAAGGHYLAESARAAVRDGTPGEDRIGLARFFAENLSVAGPGLAAAVTAGADSVLGTRIG